MSRRAAIQAAEKGQPRQARRYDWLVDGLPMTMMIGATFPLADQLARLFGDPVSQRNAPIFDAHPIGMVIAMSMIGLGIGLIEVLPIFAPLSRGRAWLLAHHRVAWGRICAAVVLLPFMLLPLPILAIWLAPADAALESLGSKHWIAALGPAYILLAGFCAGEMIRLDIVNFIRLYSFKK